jgi:uncharacterized membrane protein
MADVEIDGGAVGAEPPVPGVWRRGTTEFDRVVLLTDAVVAIAMTILVLDLRVPTGIASDDLAHAVVHDEWQGFLAFGLSFAVIAISWVGHHQFVSTLGRVDNRFLWWNFGYLAFICLMPYVSSLISSYGHETFAVVVYLSVISGLSIMGMVGIFVAVRCGFTIEPGYTPAVRYGLIDDAVRVAVFAIGIVIASFAAEPSSGLLWLLAYIPVAIFLGRFDPTRRARRGAER